MQTTDSQGVYPGYGFDWTRTADRDAVDRTRAALERRGISVTVVDTKVDALSHLKGMIPAGVEVMTGSSRTLDEIGFTDALKLNEQGWKNLKAEILAEKDKTRQMELRARSTFSEYYVGSVQAVTEDGEVVMASASGSQLAAYAFGAKNIIWVVGAQKIVSNLDGALRRVREHAFPFEDKRMKSLGYQGSVIGKILIFERVGLGQKANLLFVNDSLGF